MACIVILGGSGFLGKIVSYQLHQQGHQIRVLSRQYAPNPYQAVLPNLYWYSYQASNRDLIWQQALTGADAVIHLVGVLRASPKQYDEVHVGTLETLVDLMRKHQLKRLLHVSALNADMHAKSHYLQSKGKAEDWLRHQPDIDWTIFRPSVIYGPEDQFIRMFAKLVTWLPSLLLPCASMILSPIHVQDVAHIMTNTFLEPRCFSQTYELAGPTTLSLLELVHMISQVMNKRRLIIPLSAGLSLALAHVTSILPHPPLTVDNCLSARIPSTTQQALPDFLVPQWHDLKTSLQEMLDPERFSDPLNTFREQRPPAE